MADVATITRELQDTFRLFCRTPPCEGQQNNATAGNLSVLLQQLDAVTSELLATRETLSDWVPDAGVVAWDREMSAWRERLSGYMAAVDAAPTRDDRQTVLWSVTAPLLLGLFGGEGSQEGRRPLDAITPYRLANALQSARAARDERWDRLLDEVKQRVSDTVKPAIGIGTVLLVGAGAFVLWRVLR